MKPSRILLYCRPGFERECAQEITEIAGEMGVEGFVKARPDSGFALFQPHQEDMGVELGKNVRFRSLVFARQFVRATDLLADLPETDRAGPIAKRAREIGTSSTRTSSCTRTPCSRALSSII